MTAAYLCSDFSLRAPPTAPFAPHASSPFVEHRRPLFIHIYLFLSRLFSGEDFFSSKKLEHRDQAFEFPKFRFHFQPITPPRPSVSPRVIFSRFPPTPTYLPVLRGSCNEQIARYGNPIPRVQNDDALSTLENSLGRSFLSPRFTPTPTCSTRPCLGIRARGYTARYLPFLRGGMEKKRLTLQLQN